ncbi:peroxiredoxin-like family protein [Roseibacillus ishigakijimensis]|uniref:thioredoxin-dependent peroxiredoxin n=1 Tax=Roseibacillus ishigakijimensis TaxID=454146 RepID=A0A934RNQ1_9BACT|nr:peroxiredoxin-like family protein [Roseibacillus ishigakijimensis]MBK1832751.1 AhpC/TSA family protein [Roseibacillus ishigakijimensis]
MKRTTLGLAFLLSALSLSAEDLQDELDARKANFEKTASAEKISEYNKGVEAVKQSGILAKALNVGDQAPDFTLPNAVGKEVTLSELLKDGPVILTWYRGSWCPYCNLTLINYQENLDKIKEAGAQFVAISPEQPDQSLPTKEKHELAFQVLSDTNNQVAKDFNIVFTMTKWVEEAMREFADLKKYNGEDYDDTTLPLSATYIIQPDRTISYAFLDAEYRNRATPEQVLAALKKTKN